MDLTDPQTLNRYVYVQNNPLNFIDPTGKCFGPVCFPLRRDLRKYPQKRAGFVCSG